MIPLRTGTDWSSPRHAAGSLRRLAKNRRRELVWEWYHALARARTPRSLTEPRDSEIKKLAEEFRRNEALVMPSEAPGSVVARIKEASDKIFVKNDPAIVEHVEEYSTGIRRTADLIPFSEIFTPRVEAVLHAYCRSYFKILEASLYRTHYTNRPPAHSWTWHADNNPKHIFKLMVYLTDTDETNGAFEYHPHRAALDLYGKFNYSDRRQTDALNAVLDDASRYRTARGPRGTVLLFDNNLIHRGALPKKPGSYRDAIVLFLSPSLVHWKRHWYEKGRLLAGTQHWNSPFTT